MQADNYEVLLSQSAGGRKKENRGLKWAWQNSCRPGLTQLVSDRQVSVVNALDMQVVVSTVPPTLVEEKKDQLIR